MSVVGHQQFLQVGGRVMFKRDNDAAGIQFAMRDLGLIESVTPTIAKESVELFDTEGGRKVLIDEAVVSQSETYQVRIRNLSMRNLAIALLSNDPVDFTQTQTEKTQVIRAFPGDLLFTHDSDTAKTRLFKLDAFGGIYTGTVLGDKVLESIDVATKTFKLTGDQTGVAGLAPTKSFIVKRAGLTNVKNQNTYRIVTRTLNATKTDLVVEETPDSNESGITGGIIHENAGVVYRRDVDWELRKFGLDYGAVRIKTGGAIATEQDVTTVFTIAAISGKRKITPQSLSGVFKGTCEIWIGSENNDVMTVREGRVSITPAGMDLSIDEFSSITLDIKILSDITVATSAGRMVNVKGTLPALA